MSDYIYVYDGSYDGLMSCVFEAFEKKEMPVDVCTAPDTLLPVRYIACDEQKAARVKSGLRRTLGDYFTNVVKYSFLSRVQGAEIDILRLIKLGYQKGGQVLSDRNDPLVAKMNALRQSVGREAHRIREFIRFSDHGGNLVSVINPKHFILPLVSNHFTQRFPNENFFIFDEVHLSALVHADRKTAIIPVDEFTEPEADVEEQRFRELWQLFYDTVEIKERRNHALRMQHLPKRFWKNITELKGEL